MILEDLGTWVPKWSILGSPPKGGETNQWEQMASRAEKNYIFGGLAGALGWYIGDLGELWAYRYRGIWVYW